MTLRRVHVTALLVAPALAVGGLAPLLALAPPASAAVPLPITSGGCVRPQNDERVVCRIVAREEIWRVPPGVTSLRIVATGGAGGSTAQAQGGTGQTLATTFETFSGQDLYFVVGAKGRNGGFTHSNAWPDGGAGQGLAADGGGSTSFASLRGDGAEWLWRLVAAGGGGAARTQAGGPAGTLIPGDGYPRPRPTGSFDGEGGEAGSFQAPGAGGAATPVSACPSIRADPTRHLPGPAGQTGGLFQALLNGVAAGGQGGEPDDRYLEAGGGGGWNGGGGGAAGAVCGILDQADPLVGSGGGGGAGFGGSFNYAPGQVGEFVGEVVSFSTNTGAGEVTVGFDYELVLSPPTVTLEKLAGQADPTNSGPIRYRAVFSQPVTGFGAGDIDLSASSDPDGLQATVTEVPAPNGIKNGTTYDVVVTGMSGAGTVVASVPAGGALNTDFSSNLASTSSDSFVAYDLTPLGVTLEKQATQADPTTHSPIGFVARFTRPVVGFDAADIDLSASTTSGSLSATVTAIASASGTVDGSTYAVEVSGMRSSGDVVASVPSGSATGPFGESNQASTSVDNRVGYELGPLTVSVEQAAGQADPATTAPVRFRVEFVREVDGFDASDVSLAGSSAPGELTASVAPIGTEQTAYSVEVTGMAGDGDVVASVPAGKVSDAAGLTNEASTSTDNVVAYDHPAVGVTIDQRDDQADPTDAAHVFYTVVFDRPVSGFDSQDVDLSASTVSGPLSAETRETGPLDGTTYEVDVSGVHGDGDVVATVVAGGAGDSYGNLNAASTSTDNVVTSKRDLDGPPTVVITNGPEQASPTYVARVDFVVAFSQPVTGFTGTDVDLSRTTTPGELAVDVDEVSPFDGTRYRVRVSGMTGDGVVEVVVPADVATDAQGSTNLAASYLDDPVVVTLDTAAPTASPVMTPAPNAAGWSNEDVDVSWGWSDGAGSGLDPAACASSTTLTHERALGPLTGQCADVAGNDGTASVTLGIDKTNPVLAPTVPAVIALSAAATASANATDALSGVATQGCGALDTSSVGTRTVTCTATDAAGNTSSATTSYTVTYPFTGFIGLKPSPVPSNGTLSVRFTLTGVTGSAAATMAKNQQVQVQLRGPGSSTAVLLTRTCTWNAGTSAFACDFKAPKGVRTGPANSYRLYAQVKPVGGTFVDLPGAANPATLYYK